MTGPPFKDADGFRSSIGCILGIAVLAAGQAIAGPAPIMQRDAPVPVTTVTSEQLEKLPANRDLRTILNVHNGLRAEVRSPPLRWNPALADRAQQYANSLAATGTVEHASRAGRENERENIVVGPRSGISPVQMVQIWVNERRFFRPGTFPNVCTGDWSQCGHYTQMIWPTTTDVGCGYAKGRFDAFVCRYSPPGNRDGVAIGTTPRLAEGLCTSPGGSIIPCQNAPEGPKIAGGGEIQDDGGGRIDTGVKDEVACVVDVNLHRPISVAPDEPVIAEATELNPGATTLRNDDADWHLGQEAGAGELPVISLPTDIGRANNADENDLVKVDGVNVAGLPNVYLFAFPTHAEANRDLGTQVQPVNGGRHATALELGYHTSATKAAAAPGLPLSVPAAGVSFWTEAKLGGKYRMVIGQLVPGIAAADVRYDRETEMAYYMKEKNKVPAFICEDQATLTAAVIDIFQENRSKRLTAFDVYWAGRPHFRAEVWPGGQAFTWGAQYRLGANLHAMPGTAVTAMVASMARDAEDVNGDTNARLDGPNVTAAGNAPGNLGAKGRIEGGFQIDSPRAGNVPTVNRNPADRYPNRVSLEYLVNGEKLVRPEYLEVILPTVRPPAASMNAGSATGVASQVQYTIVDAFDRVIKAANIADYLYLYGAGMKAWEALEGQRDRVVETGPRNQPDAYNDYLFITNTGVDDRGNQRDPIGPLGTAQRSQTTVRADRMTAATFQDTLVFTASDNVNTREALWKAATGREGANPQQTRQRLEQAQAEAKERDDALNGRADPRDQGLSAADRRAAVQRRRRAVPGADQGRIASSPVLAIPQDVILQLRVGTDRHDLMVFQGNRLSVFAPYFFNDNKYIGVKSDPVFRYHIQFAPGASASQLVPPNHRRP